MDQALMDPISNADRLVRMLRQRLEERAKAQGKTKIGKPTPAVSRGPDAVRAIAGHLARSGVEGDHLNRAIIEQLLADQFDPALVNEPGFQRIVDQVTATMGADPAVAAIMNAVIVELTAG
jgi:hypothetical protein